MASRDIDEQNMNKPWHQYLLEILAGLFTKDQLRQAGASPDMMQGAMTGQVDLPTFHVEPCPPMGILESRDLKHCHPELARRYLALKADFETQTGRQLFETCTWRSQARQEALYAQGRTAPGQIVTQIDGVTKRSRHQRYPAEAIDVCVDIDPGPGKHPVWDRSSYALLGPLSEAHGLVWGGRWRIIDDPHLELPAGIV